MDMKLIFTHLEELLKSKEIRAAVLAHISEVTEAEKETEEVERARAGLASSARPDRSTAPAAPLAPAPVAPAPARAATEIVTEKVVTKNDVEEEQVFNSSTHRKEHARLSRRMSSIDPSQYPEMSRMWSGTRQDGSYCRIGKKSRRKANSSRVSSRATNRWMRPSPP